MNAKTSLLSLGLLLAATTTGVSGLATAAPPACTPPPHCGSATDATRLAFPAQALSYGSPASAFTPEARGVRWDGDDGLATLTIRRPPGYSDGEVTLSLFHELLDDSGGDIAFIVTPVSFNHFSSFETYGDELTNLVAGAEGPGLLLEHSATFAAGGPGYQWPPTGDWWYFEIRRAGSFTGSLRLMSVAIDH